MKFLVLSLVLVASALNGIVSTEADRTGVALTIYNQNLALVTETRELAVDKGIGPLRFQDMTDQIQAETAMIRSLNYPEGFRVLEQSIDNNVISERALLQRYVGREITLVDWNDYHDRKIKTKAKLLGLDSSGGGIYEINGEVFLGHPGTKVLPDLPKDMLLEPNLEWMVHCPQAKEHDVEVSYLTGGFNWTADYLLVLNDEESATLSGWATVQNGTNTLFRSADLTLIAGTPHRVTQARHAPVYHAKSLALADSAEGLSQESMFVYHAYHLDRKTNLSPRSSKQLALFPALSVRTSREYRVQGGQPYLTGRAPGDATPLPVTLHLILENNEANNMGRPLPQGVVRLYQGDSRNKLQFLGEDRINHMAEGEIVKLQAGNAFDLVAERRQLEYKRLTSKMHESKWEVTLRNHRDHPVTIALFERIYGNWSISQSTHPYEQVDANTIRFNIEVSPGGAQQLHYQVKVGL